MFKKKVKITKVEKEILIAMDTRGLLEFDSDRDLLCHLLGFMQVPLPESYNRIRNYSMQKMIEQHLRQNLATVGKKA